MSEDFDCIVIGAGPAGLTAAVYLGRFRRKFLVIDSGDARAGWIPVSHNYPAFVDGLPGKELLARLREQAGKYGATFLAGEADRLEKTSDGFVVGVGEGELRARKVLMATGVKDTEPLLPNVYEAVQRQLIRICPICDAYETIGQRVGVIGSSEKGAREALFMKTYSEAVTLIHVGEPHTLPDAEREMLARERIAVIESHIGAVSVENDRITAFDFGDGQRLAFDVVYSALGATPRRTLAEKLGAKVDKGGNLIVNDHQMTTVEGLYAAGDVVRGLNQITVAEAEAAIAATDIHNTLRAGG